MKQIFEGMAERESGCMIDDIRFVKKTKRLDGVD
jgi:hypothetical protein